MSVGRAILVGMIWVNGSAMLGFAVPIAVAVLISSMNGADEVGGPEVLIGLAVIFLLSFVGAWFAWSVQVPPGAFGPIGGSMTSKRSKLQRCR